MGVPHSELKPNPGVFTFRLIFLNQGLYNVMVVMLNIHKTEPDLLQNLELDNLGQARTQGKDSCKGKSRF